MNYAEITNRNDKKQIEEFLKSKPKYDKKILCHFRFFRSVAIKHREL